MSAAEHANHEPPAAHHETADVNIGGVFAFGATLLAVGIVIHLLVWLLFRYFAAEEAHRFVPQYPLAISQEQQLPPEPRLQTNPREDLRELRAREDALLATYGWVDRNDGVVRIPIDRAMKLVLEHGLPARQGVRPPPAISESGDANSGQHVGEIKP
ncbi:MAG: hypothetical protein ACM3SQ_17115 [Betaproteobacteria bacterium]